MFSDLDKNTTQFKFYFVESSLLNNWRNMVTRLDLTKSAKHKDKKGLLGYFKKL